MQVQPGHLVFSVNLGAAISEGGSGDIQSLRVVNTDPKRYLVFALRSRYVGSFTVRPSKACIPPGQSVVVTLVPLDREIVQQWKAKQSKRAPSSVTSSSVSSAHSATTTTTVSETMTVTSTVSSAASDPGVLLSDVFRLDHTFLDAQIDGPENDELLLKVLKVPEGDLPSIRSQLALLFTTATGASSTLEPLHSAAPHVTAAAAAATLPSSIKAVESLMRLLVPSTGAHLVHKLVTFSAIDAADTPVPLDTEVAFGSTSAKSTTAPSSSSCSIATAGTTALSPKGDVTTALKNDLSPSEQDTPPAATREQQPRHQCEPDTEERHSDAASASGATLVEEERQQRRASELESDAIELEKAMDVQRRALEQLEHERALLLARRKQQQEIRQEQAAQTAPRRGTSVAATRSSPDDSIKIIFSEYKTFATVPFWFALAVLAFLWAARGGVAIIQSF